MVKLLILASVGALIGWMTNVLAIRLLFRPVKPVKIPILGISIQGLMPKRKQDIARNIGQTVESELLSSEEIMNKLIEGTDKSKIIESLKWRIMNVVNEKMPPFLAGTMGGLVESFVTSAIDEHAEDMLSEIGEKMIYQATHTVHVSEIIEEKINAFPFEKLEEIILGIAKKELHHIEILGGVIGFFIGLAQGLIILIL